MKKNYVVFIASMLYTIHTLNIEWSLDIYFKINLSQILRNMIIIIVFEDSLFTTSRC